jgi:hypothetical protein
MRIDDITSRIAEILDLKLKQGKSHFYIQGYKELYKDVGFKLAKQGYSIDLQEILSNNLLI